MVTKVDSKINTDNSLNSSWELPDAKETNAYKNAIKIFNFINKYYPKNDNGLTSYTKDKMSKVIPCPSNKEFKALVSCRVRNGTRTFSIVKAGGLWTLKNFVWRVLGLYNFNILKELKSEKKSIAKCYNKKFFPNINEAQQHFKNYNTFDAGASGSTFMHFKIAELAIDTLIEKIDKKQSKL